MERVILLVLLCAKDFTVPASVLVERLWRGERIYMASGALRTHIHNIRKAITRVAGPGAAKALLETVNGLGGATYRLAVDADSIDLRRWELALSAARDELLWEPGREAEARMAAVVNAWRGDPFEDVKEWDFARTERQRLADLHRDAAVELADFRFGMCRYREAAVVLQPLTGSFPGDFGIWQRLILALWRGRQDQAAAQACKDCTETLHSLRLDLSEVQALHTSLLNGTLPRADLMIV